MPLELSRLRAEFPGTLEKQQTKDAAGQAIKNGLLKLTPAFTRGLQPEKFALTFSHIYAS